MIERVISLLESGAPRFEVKIMFESYKKLCPPKKSSKNTRDISYLKVGRTF